MPEFGIIAALVLGGAVGAIIVQSRHAYGEIFPLLYMRSDEEIEYRQLYGRYPHKSMSFANITDAVKKYKTA